ncbi:hypothetical protein PFICI_00011 [Pestalotiopsis fici W106-1]|uniref:Uncharacterized protein n=1 Tax=Pestalotiopsis fici (strain W106-1 / CGMCC3.15140) TaxID=1229662 RepID=W3XJF4_PESFW|nr:uncharacterized protein PFICI_00011 [Pestalotiopsis fici W106-1]ETS86183.1 hypothetical protein PFICI_00011 [Pestalotiopsis fici W106-1]
MTTTMLQTEVLHPVTGISTGGRILTCPPTLDIPVEAQVSLLHDRSSYQGEVPGLRINTVPHRQRISTAAQIDFRVKLLGALRKKWEKPETEARFLEAVNRMETDGAALFGGLIDPSIFGELVEKYDKVQERAGNKAFMHSYVNLSLEHEFILGGSYVEAFSHPLLVALVSYLLGGSIRIVDFRGKNTDPISINAQDNMLHVDNTPFKEEYKVLLNWRRGEVKGPSGQNFTFLPWTHKGNRIVLKDKEGAPWSSEKDSVFVTDEAIDGLFEFQNQVKGAAAVVEARHSEQPLAILFPAGALVHHRYRTEDGDPRSCIITAFHLSSKHPGQISELAHVSDRKKTLIEFLVGYQDENSNDEFLDLISGESLRVETKLEELVQPQHPSTVLDIGSLALKGEALVKWRQAVMAAPNPIWHRLNNGLRLSETDFGDIEMLTDNLAAVMDYDKHCNLQMVLYDDGREEIRKPSRKIVGERKKDNIRSRLRSWTPRILRGSFNAHDLIEPRTLRILSNSMASLAEKAAEEHDTEPAAGSGKSPLVGQRKTLMSFSRLILDLGEAVERCEGVESFVVTSLFLFLAAEEIYSELSVTDQKAVEFVVVAFLRNYIATVLIVEGNVDF